MIGVRHIFLTGLLLVQTGICAQRVQSAVLFGSHSAHVHTEEENSYKVFMDMNGDYYPETVISDVELRNEGNSQLEVWANAFPAKFTSIAMEYGLVDSLFSESSFEVLQDSIVANIAREIEVKSSSESLTWLIHGFRKRLYGDESRYERSSLLDNDVVENEIAQLLNDSAGNQTFFVEVYWDGKYVPLQRSMRSKVQLAKLFRDEAIPNAQKAGHSLRRIFSRLDSEEMRIVSHSAGTHVVSSLLFNVESDYELPTPNNKDIRIALVAAAAPGVKLFKHYYSRNTNAAFSSEDNYSIMNVYNERDFVLRKFGFSRRYGDTSLGCNHSKESHKLKKYFVKNFPNSRYLEQSITAPSPANHFFVRYARSEGFKNVIDFLYGN